MLRLKACVCTHESKCTRRARFRWLILNVSACQTTRFSVCSILHATPSVKERCIALGHRNKKGDFNDLADEMHNPYATNAGGSKKKKIKKDAVKRWFAWQRSSLALPACSLPHIPLFTRCSALW